jgi:hypothetical protein
VKTYKMDVRRVPMKNMSQMVLLHVLFTVMHEMSTVGNAIVFNFNTVQLKSERE